MKKHSTIQEENRGFYRFVFHDHVNRRRLLILSGLIVVEYVLFKILYPYPSFFSDSYSYIFAAASHLDVNVWPIGYSKFLEYFPWFTRSHQALVAVQYLLIEAAGVYFFFTLLYWYKPGRVTRRILAFFLFSNPLLLYIANYVTSDALFLSISLLWITQLVWVIHRPRLIQILWQGLLLFLAFIVRYNAMIYPVVGAFAFLISTHRPWAKAVAIVLGPLLLIPFILHSRTAAQQLTGVAQFPILSGWQWGNNALYFREHIDIKPGDLPTLETSQLDSLAVQFFTTTPPDKRDLPNYVANYFIRQSEAPLRKYMHLHYTSTSEYNNLINWATVSPVYGDYGRYLVAHHLPAYTRYYLLVNAKNYFLPPLEQLSIYNLGLDTIWHRGQRWFQLPSPKVTVSSHYLQEPLLLIYTPLFLLLNLLYLFVLGMLLLGKSGILTQSIARTTLLVSSFLLLNFGFSVFANIIVIRYQLFPMIVLLSFSLIVLEWVFVGRNVAEKPINMLPDPSLLKLS